MPMTESPGRPSTGWYRDPSGRHQHRFWDGERWTSRVATEGVETSDPPVATLPKPKRRNRPARSRGVRWPLIAGLAIVLAAAIAATVYVVVHEERRSEPRAVTTTTTVKPTTTTPGNLAGSVAAPGAGTFTIDVAGGQAIAHLVHLRPGQTAVVGWRVASGDATVRAGISAPTVDRLSDHQFVSDAQRSTAQRDAEAFAGELRNPPAGATGATQQDPTVEFAGFHGVVLGPPDTFVAPVVGDYGVVVVGTAPHSTLQFTIRVRDEPSVRGDLRADAYNHLIQGSFRGAVNRFVTDYCATNPTLDRGACDRFQTDDDGWPVTGADPAPVPQATPGSGTQEGGPADTAPADTGPSTTAGSPDSGPGSGGSPDSTPNGHGPFGDLVS